MQNKLRTDCGLFVSRISLAFLLFMGAVSLGALSLAGVPGRSGANATGAVAPAAPGFHAPVTMPGSNGGSEPSLSINQNGVRFVSWQSPGKFARSSDGVNFVQAATPDSGAAGDVTNAMGANGALYNGQICGLPTELHTCIYRSLDNGATWERRSLLADNHPGAADRPWIAVKPGANPDQDTVYVEFHTFSPDDLVYVTKSTDGGATFGPPVPVETGTNSAISDSGCNTIPGGVIVDKTNGDLYALWLSGDQVAQNVITGCTVSQIGPFTKAWVSRSTDGGTTWAPALAWHGSYDPTTNIGDNAGKIFSTISQDTSGQVHIGLSVRHNDDPRGFLLACEQSSACLENPSPTDMYIVTSPDQGAHWTLPFQVNQSTGSYFFPWIDAGSAGRLVVANYFSSTLQPNNKASVWYIGMYQVTGAVAHYVSGMNATYDSTPVASPQVQLDPNRVHGNGTSGGGICTYGTFCLAVPGSNRGLADVFEIHLDPAGGANITWTSDNGGNHIGFACQNSGPSSIGGAPDLNGCYGPTDMSITKTASPDPVAPGGTLTYHLSVTNNGMPTMPATTSGVVLTDVLPAGVTFVSATPSSGTCSGTSTVTCALGIFPSGATATVDISVTVPNSSGTITNTATVAAATADPNLANNTATSVNTISSVAPTRVVSRKMHGGAGTFSIDLPLTGTPGVECRTAGHLPDGASGDYQLVFTFGSELTSVVGATVTSHNPANASGSVLTSMIDSADRHNYIVNLTNVSNAQYLTVTLNNVVTSGFTANVVGPPMGVLFGDVNGDGFVLSGDYTATRQRSGAPVNTSTFRYDVNADGFILSGDYSVVRQKSGTKLP